MQTQQPMTEIEKLVDVLSSFPEEQQEALAAYYRAEAEHIRDVEEQLDNLRPEQTEQLRQMIQAGIDSGPAGAVDFEEIKRRGRQRLATEGGNA